jgi:hypothetical protein
MTIEQKSREIALSFINLDDVVVTRELSGNGMSILAMMGRSVVGTAVTGGGLAARAALFGVQVVAKSAMATTAAAKGLVPGADAAERAMYDLDRRLGASAERASFIASRGVEIGKADEKPPTDPILGDPWLGKRLDPDATWNTVLADSAADLSQLAMLPLTLTMAATERAMGSATGQRVGKKVWDSMSSLIDATSGASAAGEAAERADARAILLTIGATPLWLAFQDGIDLCEGLSRAALGDVRRFRAVLTQLVERLEASDADATENAPAKLLAALDEHDATEPSSFFAISAALVEDGPKLAKLAGIYSMLLAKLVDGSMRSAVDAASGSAVDEIEAWIRLDEDRRSAGSSALSSTGSSTVSSAGTSAGGSSPVKPRPALLERLEHVASVGTADAPNSARAFFTPSTIDLARDMVFSYSSGALGRERGLARVGRLFGRAVRDRIADDCSLREDILDAGRERDRRIAAVVTEHLRHGRARLLAARDHAAARLATLSSSSRDNMVERLVPLRIVERATVLRRFVAMADTANSLDGMPSDEPSRQRIVARFDAWIDAQSDDSDAARESSELRSRAG